MLFILTRDTNVKWMHVGGISGYSLDGKYVLTFLLAIATCTVPFENELTPFRDKSFRLVRFNSYSIAYCMKVLQCT